MKLLQHILYINLEHRTDRKEHFEQQIESLNKIIEEEKWGEEIHPERFNAVSNSNGALGCSMSHVECLKIAQQRKYPYVCILEDDIVFTNPKLFLEQLKTFEDQFTDEWDMLLVGGNVFRSQHVQPYCSRVLNSQTTIGYIVQQSYYSTLLQNFESGVQLLTRNHRRKGSYAIDIHWKSLQTKDKWYIIKPITISQRPDYSDIEKRKTNYTHCMLKRIQ